MANKPNTCIFCAGTGLTNEHVIPDWVKQLIPRRKRTGNLFTLTDHAARHRSQKARQGSVITKKVRAVCGPCNHGWLSTLEDELKPTLTDLILGNPATLTHWKQRRLATWAVKTAMTAELIHPPTAVISFELREHLRLHREPHEEFDVWAGFYPDEGGLLGLEHHSGKFNFSTPGTEPIGSLNTQATTIGLGCLFLQIAYCGVPGARFELKDESVSKLRRIWPPGDHDLSWPPPSALDATDIAIILKGIHNAFEDTLI